MICKICGEYMEGDGYHKVLHCPNAPESLYESNEPDSNPVNCVGSEASDVIIVSWPSGGEARYGLLTNESYPKVAGVGRDVQIAKSAKRHGAGFVNTLFFNRDLNSLESYVEVEDE